MATTFTIVEFLDDNVVDFVPSNWLYGRSETYWPKTQVSTKRSLRTDPDPLNSHEWPVYKIRILRSAVDTETAARRKARQAEFTSNLDDSFSELPEKRKRINTARYVEEGNKSPISASQASDDEEDSVTTLNSPVIFSFNQKSKFSKSKSRPRASSPIDRTRSISKTPASCNCSIKQLEQKISLQHNVVIETVNEVLRRIGQLESRPTASDDAAGEQNIGSQLQLPCKNLDELKKVGAELEGNLQERVALIKLLSRRVVPLEVHTTIKGFIRILMTDEVASSISRDGKKGKLSLNSLPGKLLSLMQDAALKGDRRVNIATINKAITEQLKRIGSHYKRRSKE